MCRPNFFIVGAPKCGTTSLLAYLLEHPDVYAPGTWEFNFLNGDLTWISEPPIRSEEEYLSHFQTDDDYRRVGEKSAFYLYSERAPNRIYNLNPKAKIICIFRDPVEVMWSLYRYHLQAQRENITSFERALEAEGDRKEGCRIPEQANFVEDLLYRNVVRYTDQLERYLGIFGREAIHVILFRDLVNYTDRVYKEVLRFLEVEPISLDSYKPHNTSPDVVGTVVRRLLGKYPVVQSALRTVFPSRVKEGIKKLLGGISGGEPIGEKKMRSETRVMLNKEFRSEAERLEELLGRDLSHWCVPVE